jgi:hypothetical protein
LYLIFTKNKLAGYSGKLLCKKHFRQFVGFGIEGQVFQVRVWVISLLEQRLADLFKQFFF